MALRYFGCNTNPRVHKQEDYRDGHATKKKKIQLASRPLSLTKIILKIKMEHFEGKKKKKKKFGKKY